MLRSAMLRRSPVMVQERADSSANVSQMVADLTAPHSLLGASGAALPGSQVSTLTTLTQGFTSFPPDTLCTS